MLIVGGTCSAKSVCLGCENWPILAQTSRLSAGASADTPIPGLTEAILNGLQLEDSDLAQLTKSIPIEWEKQRELLPSNSEAAASWENSPKPRDLGFANRMLWNTALTDMLCGPASFNLSACGS